MNKIESIVGLLVIILIFAITAILFDWFKPEPVWLNPSTRITLKAETTINQQGYRIIEVDSVEYICSPNGICPLVKK